MIGIFVDEFYNGRIFCVVFDLGDVNIEDCVVFEVINGDTS